MFPFSDGTTIVSDEPAIVSDEPAIFADEPAVFPGEPVTCFERKSILDDTVVSRNERFWLVTADSPVIQYLLFNRRYLDLTPHAICSLKNFTTGKFLVVIIAHVADRAYETLVYTRCHSIGLDLGFRIDR